MSVAGPLLNPPPPASENSAPDWSAVPFDVGCARCGQDLRGLSEPVCPACSLEFDWADAVPIERLTCRHCGYHLFGLTETRCPECGESFTWEDALEWYYHQRLPLFEYRWRSTPIRSLWRSFRTSLSLRRTWRLVDLHDPPPVKPLVMLGLGAMAVAWAAAFLLHFAVRSLVNLKATGGWRAPISQLQWMLNWDAEAWMVPAIGAAFYLGGGFAALLLLRWSMALCKVRNGHVLRAFVYSALPLTLFPFLVVAVLIVSLTLVVYYDFYDFDWQRLALLALIGTGVVLLTARIAYSYRVYIRMRHAWAIAISTQLIALLTGMLALMFGAIFTNQL